MHINAPETRSLGLKAIKQSALFGYQQILAPEEHTDGDTTPDQQIV